MVTIQQYLESESRLFGNADLAVLRYRSVKTHVISPLTLSKFDSYFSSCMTDFSLSCSLTAYEPLDPRMLAPVCHLMNARLILYRHNLSTSCLLEVQGIAIEQCIRVALESTNFLTRAMAASNASHPFGPTANTMTCTHIWRCTLFLLFGGHFDEALTCIRASATISTLRDVSVACGRNLAFFLSVLIELPRPARTRRGPAYVTGDLQAAVLTDVEAGD